MAVSRLFTRFIKDVSGATAIEYGLIAGLVVLAIVSALTLYGEQMTAMFDHVENTASAAISKSGPSGSPP